MAALAPMLAAWTESSYPGADGFLLLRNINYGGNTFERTTILQSVRVPLDGTLARQATEPAATGSRPRWPCGLAGVNHAGSGAAPPKRSPRRREAAGGAGGLLEGRSGGHSDSDLSWRFCWSDHAYLRQAGPAFRGRLRPLAARARASLWISSNWAVATCPLCPLML